MTPLMSASLIGVNKPLVIHYESVEYSLICCKVDFQIPVALNSIQHGVFGMKKTRVYSMVILCHKYCGDRVVS